MPQSSTAGNKAEADPKHNWDLAPESGVVDALRKKDNGTNWDTPDLVETRTIPNQRVFEAEVENDAIGPEDEVDVVAVVVVD